MIVWWVWVLFAVANLIDLAIQGRGYGAIIAAVSVLFVTGLVYAAALRPRLLIDDDGLTVVNPVREHRVRWAAVADAEALDLLRIRCLVAGGAVPGAELPGAAVPGAGKDGGGPARRSLWVWGVHSSRRKQISADLRAERRSQGGGFGRGGLGRGGGGFGGGLGGGGLGSAQRGAFSWSGNSGKRRPGAGRAPPGRARDCGDHHRAVRPGSPGGARGQRAAGRDLGLELGRHRGDGDPGAGPAGGRARLSGLAAALSGLAAAGTATRRRRRLVSGLVC